MENNSTPMQKNSSSQQMKTFREVMRTTDIMLQISNKFLDEMGISGQQYNVLSHLNTYNACTHTELGAKLLRSTPNMSTLIDRMEKNALVTRIRDIKDRRKYMIQITDKGRSLVNKISPTHREFVSELMDGLSKSEQDQLVILMRKMGDHFKEKLEKL